MNHIWLFHLKDDGKFWVFALRTKNLFPITTRFQTKYENYFCHINYASHVVLHMRKLTQLNNWPKCLLYLSYLSIYFLNFYSQLLQKVCHFQLLRQFVTIDESISVTCYDKSVLSEGHKNYFQNWCLINSQCLINYSNLTNYCHIIKSM